MTTATATARSDARRDRVRRDVRALAGSAAYIAISFPLALAAFVVIATGVAVGVGLAPTLLGIPVLALSLLAARGVERGDRWIAHWLLGDDEPSARFDPANGATGLVRGAWANLARPSGWRALANQLVRPVVTGVTWVATVTVLSVGAGLATAPAWYTTGHLRLPSGAVDTLPAAIACVPVGVALVAAAAPALVWTARAQRALTRLVAGHEA